MEFCLREFVLEYDMGSKPPPRTVLDRKSSNLLPPQSSTDIFQFGAKGWALGKLKEDHYFLTFPFSVQHLDDLIIFSDQC